MKKGIFALGLAFAITGLGIKDVAKAVGSDSTGSNSTSDSSVTSPKNSSIDTSKITGSNENIRNALIKTLEAAAEDPDTSSENGRKIAQLLNSVKQGHTLSASIVINDDPEITENILQILLQETAGDNLASISDIKFVVTDATDSNSSVNLTALNVPVTVTLPIPSQYKAALSSRRINIFHVDSDNETNVISNAKLDANGDVAFETSRFSLFALAYDGEPITVTTSSDASIPQTSAANVTTAATAVTAETDTAAAVAPDTAGFFGIELTVFNLVMIIGIALVAIALAAYAGKRAYIRNRISLK
ncbi:hypothetical protein IKG48_01715 [Candidatus Saccharibacteria bacterium]|nr:hypothetical protein [Candidatus Saccharibacteria bacterium]